jgi:hypothetical protein
MQSAFAISAEILRELKAPADKNAEVAQLVEHHLAKVRVAGSNLVFRSELNPFAQQMDFFFTKKCSLMYCPGGGIGRHAGLKILFAEKASAGSSPAPGTFEVRSTKWEVGSEQPIQVGRRQKVVSREQPAVVVKSFKF